MPRALSKKSQYTVSLDSDIAEYPDPSLRPTFVFRFLPAGDWADLQDVRPQIEASTNAKQAVLALAEMIAKPLVKWTNIVWPNNDEPVEFDAGDAPAKLANILTLEEMKELLQKSMVQQQPTESDRKNSDSPAQSGQASSAPTAEVAA